MVFIPWWDMTANPIQVPTAMTYQTTGQWLSAWFGSPEMRQIGVDIRLHCSQITATEKVTVSVATDFDDSAGGFSVLGTITNNGTTALKFPNNGRPFKTIRIKLQLDRGGTTTLTPRVYSAILRWTPQPRALWSYAFDVDLSKGYDGNSPNQLEEALETASDAGVVTFAYRPDEDRYVRVEHASALTYGGADSRGKWSLSVSEVIPISDTVTTFLWDGASKWGSGVTWG